MFLNLFRRALLLATMALAAACSSPSEPPATKVALNKDARFGTAQTLTVGQSARFEDGLKVLLVQVDDSRCRPDVQCIWQGELSPLLHLVGGAIGATRQELRLGTERATSAAMGGYQFVLNDALVDSATVTVTKASDQSSKQDDLVR